MSYIKVQWERCQRFETNYKVHIPYNPGENFLLCILLALALADLWRSNSYLPVSVWVLQEANTRMNVRNVYSKNMGEAAVRQGETSGPEWKRVGRKTGWIHPRLNLGRFSQAFKGVPCLLDTDLPCSFISREQQALSWLLGAAAGAFDQLHFL